MGQAPDRTTTPTAATAMNEGANVEQTAKLQAPISVAVARERPIAGAHAAAGVAPTKLETRAMSVSYGSFVAVREISMVIPSNKIAAIIGPSGSGKSTLLRALNRMHDALPSAKVQGDVMLDGQPIYGSSVDPV